MKSADIIRRLEDEGWTLVRVKGSHHQFKHPENPGLVTVPHPRADIMIGTLRSIYRQADWKWR
jgi:predicted RNA binding protein YcfA (HicA-like mRNA interferase family)